MDSVAPVVKSVGPKLVPFFKTVAIYFVVFLPYDQPSLLSTVLKCLPILSLMLFVALHGVTMSEEHYFQRKILTGLIFCCLGDAFLIWPKYFELGMVAFAIGHIQYILAFKFKPLNLRLGIYLYTVQFFVYLYLLPGLHGILIPGLALYTIIISTMLWRAWARVQLFEKENQSWSWCKLSAGIGALLFAVSDLLIGIDRFKYPVGHSQALIMATYYTAQLGIVLSVVDAKAVYFQQERRVPIHTE